MQNKITLDGVVVKQPDEFEPNWATTYTTDSGRPMSGKAIISPLFTVESFSVKFTELKPNEAKTILQAIIPRPSKPYFQLHYYSWYYGTWKTGEFYVGDGTMKCRTLKENAERLQEITCDFVGRERIC